MSEPINNAFPTLQQLASYAIINSSPQTTLSGDFKDADPDLVLVKEIWGSLKDTLSVVFGQNNIIENIEKSLVAECCTTYKIHPIDLSFESKQTLVLNNVKMLFRKLAITLNLPVNFTAWTELQEKWDAESLIFLWTQGICLNLERNAPELSTASEIRSWMINPENKVLLNPTLIKTLNVPVDFAALHTLQKQWEEEALIILWTECICNHLGENAPVLLSAGEIRAWMTDPDNEALLNPFTVVDLCNLGIKAIPPEIKNLKLLSKLYLSGNEIKCIPDFLGSLTHLTSLYLSSNQISCIPNSIGSCQNLQFLDLGKNKITKIPEAMLGLTELERLWLHDNKISTIPDVLLSLKKLHILHLRENPLFLYATEGTLPQKDLYIEGRPGNTENVQAFLSDAKALNDYQCAGCFSLFIKRTLHAVSKDRHDLVKEALNELSAQDKDLICKTYYFMKHPMIIFWTYSDDGSWEDSTLFEDMDAFCQATLKAIFTKYDGLSPEQKEIVVDQMKLEGEHAFNNILLLSDVMEELVGINL